MFRAERVRPAAEVSANSSWLQGIKGPHHMDDDDDVIMLTPSIVLACMQHILQELKLPKINLLLIHWPTAFKKTGGELFPKDDKGK